MDDETGTTETYAPPDDNAYWDTDAAADDDAYWLDSDGDWTDDELTDDDEHTPELDGAEVAALVEAFRGDIEAHVDARFQELYGVDANGQPVGQEPPLPPYAAEVHANLLLADVVSRFGDQPELAHLKGIDPYVVIERAMQIAPVVMAFEGETDAAAAKALYIAAEAHYTEQQGERTVTDEINLRNKFFANGQLNPAWIRHAAETAFNRGNTDVNAAIREGFELAGGRTTGPGNDRALVGFYGAKAKQIRESSGLSRHGRAELTRLVRQESGEPMSDSKLAAKYAKAATDYKVATGRIPARAV